MDNIVVYNDGELELKVSDNKDTIWASINDITKVFDIDRSVVSRLLFKLEFLANYFIKNHYTIFCILLSVLSI